MRIGLARTWPQMDGCVLPQRREPLALHQRAIGQAKNEIQLARAARELECDLVLERRRERTPPTSAAILAGITRDTAITLLREQGVDVREEPIARDELYVADEVFLTGTAAEITPVREIDHRRIGRGEAGPVTRRLQESFFSVVKGTDTRHTDWLTFV